MNTMLAHHRTSKNISISRHLLRPLCDLGVKSLKNDYCSKAAWKIMMHWPARGEGVVKNLPFSPMIFIEIRFFTNRKTSGGQFKQFFFKPLSTNSAIWQKDSLPGKHIGLKGSLEGTHFRISVRLIGLKGRLVPPFFQVSCSVATSRISRWTTWTL